MIFRRGQRQQLQQFIDLGGVGWRLMVDGDRSGPVGGSFSYVPLHVCCCYIVFFTLVFAVELQFSRVQARLARNGLMYRKMPVVNMC